MAPSVSIRAEPRVAVVDENVDRKGTRSVAEDYLNFLYSETAQQDHCQVSLPAQHAGDSERTSGRVCQGEVVPDQGIAQTWDQANQKFFVDWRFSTASIPTRNSHGCLSGPGN